MGSGNADTDKRAEALERKAFDSDAHRDFALAVNAAHVYPLGCAYAWGGELLAMLRELEAVKFGVGSGHFCPCCDQAWEDDEAPVHAESCRLDALLRRYKR